MSENNNNATPASDAAMAARLADFQRWSDRVQRRIERKKAAVKKLEDKVKALTQQRSAAKLASTRDMKLITGFSTKIRERHADIKTETLRHDRLCKDFQKLIDQKNGCSEAELMALLGEMLAELLEDDSSEGEGEDGEGEEKEA